eukprot:1153531-Prymnesium_polylepis.1
MPSGASRISSHQKSHHQPEAPAAALQVRSHRPWALAAPSRSGLPSTRLRASSVLTLLSLLESSPRRRSSWTMCRASVAR